jgi:TolB-like protein/DNA-binding winged helix-turn-helix (wHTH) protein
MYEAARLTEHSNGCVVVSGIRLTECPNRRHNLGVRISGVEGATDTGPPKETLKISAARTARFGPYSLDLRSGELRKLGTKIKMGEQSFRILCLLLDANGEMVTREELRTKLWPSDTFVDFDHGLNSAVQRLRDCLSDSAENPRWIQTVPRRGYRFVGQVDWRQAEKPVPANSKDTKSPQTEALLVAAPSAETASRRWPFAAAILILVAAGITLGYCLYRQSEKRQAARSIRSLAVLPLENLSGDPKQDYFADGMTDELTTMLAKNRSLRVVSRTSAMQYKGVHRPLRDIASALGVDGILEGSLARTANRMHLNVQLIYAPTDTHVWAETYDRDLEGAFSLPEELSQAVAKEVNTATSDSAKQRYINPEAHDAYLRGRYFWFAGNDQRSQEYFEKAIQIQPDYAAPWAGVADSYSIRAIDDECPAKDVMAQIEASAHKAVGLDDSLPAAHHSLAAWYLFFAWDLPRADAESRRSIELDPAIAEQHHLHSYILLALNRNYEALQEQKRATDLDPFARSWALGHAYLQLRQFDAAISELRMRADAFPNEPWIHLNLYGAYRYKGMWNDSERELEQGLKLSGQPEAAEAARQAFARGGERAVEEWAVSDAVERARKGYVAPYEIAKDYAFLGDKADTLRFLEQSYREHYPWLILLQTEPMFDFVHPEPRYQALIKKLGLPPSY